MRLFHFAEGFRAVEPARKLELITVFRDFFHFFLFILLSIILKLLYLHRFRLRNGICKLKFSVIMKPWILICFGTRVINRTCVYSEEPISELCKERGVSPDVVTYHFESLPHIVKRWFPVSSNV